MSFRNMKFETTKSHDPYNDSQLKFETDDSIQTAVDYPHAFVGNVMPGDYMPSNNSSRTFCDHQASPRQEIPKVADDTQFEENMGVSYPFPHDTSLDHGYPTFPFPYEGANDDFSRYRAAHPGMYSAQPNYDMSYMQQLTQLSSRLEDPQNGLSNQPHCAIPLGKRRPRAIMISNETNTMSPKMYSNSGNDYGQAVGSPPDMKNAYSLPVMNSWRYFSGYPQAVTYKQIFDPSRNQPCILAAW
jgi:hypothetical protein